MLHAPDFVVDDVVAAVAQLVSSAGLPEPDPLWFQRFPRHGYHAVFARVAHSRTSAPSRLELITDIPTEGEAAVDANIGAMSAWQGDRPVKTHATVATCSDMDGLASWLSAKKVRFRIDPPSPDLGHERLWIGSTSEDPANYSPDDDCGLIFEVISTQCLQLGPKVFEPPQRSIGEDDPSMVRVDRRCWLVDDMEAVLQTLDTRLGWPAERILHDPASGTKRAVMATNIGHSAKLELIQPGDDTSPEGRFAAAWGPGAYAVRIAVGSIDAKVQELQERNVVFSDHDETPTRPRVVRIDTDVLDNMMIEFVALSDVQ